MSQPSPAQLHVDGKGYDCLYDPPTSQILIPAFEEGIREWYERFQTQEIFDTHLEVIGGDCIRADGCQVKVFSMVASIGDKCWFAPICSAQSESASVFPTGLQWRSGTALTWNDVKVALDPGIQEQVRRLQVNIAQDSGQKAMGGHLFVEGDVPAPRCATEIHTIFGDAIEFKAKQADFISANLVKTNLGDETMMTWISTK
jgi:hypothetical protein